MCKLIKYYEELHRSPELSGQEEKTADYLMSVLADMGYRPVRIGKHGVYADLCVDASFPWVLFRSDMDALPVAEETNVSYASQNSGVMHAEMSVSLRASSISPCSSVI